MVRGPALVRRRRAPGGRVSGLPERDASEGHPPGPEDRDAGRRDGLRGAAGRRRSAARLRRSRRGSTARTSKAELWKVRNFHQGFKHGLWAGLFHSGLQMFSGGRGLVDPMAPSKGYAEIHRLADDYGPGASREDFERKKADGTLTFDRLTDVYHSGTKHDEDQPVHLPRGRHEHLRDPLRGASTATPARSSAPRRSTRWSPRATTRRTCASRSTSPTASTARRATSWIPTRSSPGSLPRAGAAPLRRSVSGVAFFDHPVFDEHDAGDGHPERPARLERSAGASRRPVWQQGWTRVGRGRSRELAPPGPQRRPRGPGRLDGGDGSSIRPGHPAGPRSAPPRSTRRALSRTRWRWS